MYRHLIAFGKFNRADLQNLGPKASHLQHLIVRDTRKLVVFDTEVAKVSIVGLGMRSHAGVAARMFEVLAKEGINIQMISTSEI